MLTFGENLMMSIKVNNEVFREVNDEVFWRQSKFLTTLYAHENAVFI